MMKFKLKAYSIQEFGQRKDAQGNPHQEDSIYPLHGKQTDADRLFILCDGMGGHDAGEVASATVCEAMSQSVNASVPNSEALFTDDMLLKAVADAFHALDQKDNGASKKMGTTMTFLKLHAGGATIAHMGDSRVYHIRPGKDADSTQILFMTEDHSLVNDLIKIGELTPEEAKVSPQKNIITRAMQPHMERQPKADIHHVTDIKPGDYFYLCSDGMLEEMEDANIRFNFSDMNGDDENKVQVLTNATIDNRDNHTALIIHILDVEGEAEGAPAPSVAPAQSAASSPTFTADAIDDEQPVVPNNPANTACPTPANSNRKAKGMMKFVLALVITLLAAAAYFIVPMLLKNKPEPAKPNKPNVEQKDKKKKTNKRRTTTVAPANKPEKATATEAVDPNKPTEAATATEGAASGTPTKPNASDKPNIPNKPTANPAKPNKPAVAPHKPAAEAAPEHGAHTSSAAPAATETHEHSAVDKLREGFSRHNQAADAPGKGMK